MLRLDIPRAEQAKPRQIPVTAVTESHSPARRQAPRRQRQAQARSGRDRGLIGRCANGRTLAERPAGRDASRPVYVISVAAELVSVHPRTLRIYEGEGLVCPARTPTNIRLYSENDLRRSSGSGT